MDLKTLALLLFCISVVWAQDPDIGAAEPTEPTTTTEDPMPEDPTTEPMEPTTPAPEETMEEPGETDDVTKVSLSPSPPVCSREACTATCPEGECSPIDPPSCCDDLSKCSTKGCCNSTCTKPDDCVTAHCPYCAIRIGEDQAVCLSLEDALKFTHTKIETPDKRDPLHHPGEPEAQTFLRQHRVRGARQLPPNAEDSSSDLKDATSSKTMDAPANSTNTTSSTNATEASNSTSPSPPASAKGESEGDMDIAGGPGVNVHNVSRRHIIHKREAMYKERVSYKANVNQSQGMDPTLNQTTDSNLTDSNMDQTRELNLNTDNVVTDPMLNSEPEIVMDPVVDPEAEIVLDPVVDQEVAVMDKVDCSAVRCLIGTCPTPGYCAPLRPGECCINIEDCRPCSDTCEEQHEDGSCMNCALVSCLGCPTGQCAPILKGCCPDQSSCQPGGCCGDPCQSAYNCRSGKGLCPECKPNLYGVLTCGGL